MAYIDNRTGRGQRGAAMAAVAVLQGAVVVALVHGLAVKLIDRPPPTRTEGMQIPLEPLPPQPPPPPSRIDEPAKPQPRDSLPMPVARPKPPIDVANVPSAVPFDPPSPLPPRDPVIADPPSPPPSPAVPARSAMPRGNPGSWVTANDYPAQDLRMGNQGVTRFRLTIGADGAVRSCAITRSSGFAGLDDATCRRLMRRAAFRPATDAGGNPVASEYSNAIRWVIPE